MYGLSGREELKSGVIIVWGPTGVARSVGAAAEGGQLPPGQPGYRITVYRNRDDEQASRPLKEISFNTFLPEAVDRRVRGAIEEAQQ